MDGGAWWAMVHGVIKSWTWLSDFTFTFHFHAWEKEMATHSNVLAWRIPGMGELGGLLSMGSQRVGHDWSDLAVTYMCVCKYVCMYVYTHMYTHIQYTHTCLGILYICIFMCIYTCIYLCVYVWCISLFMHILNWPKSPFRFFRKILWRNELLVNTMYLV